MQNAASAELVLENGDVFQGTAFGYMAETVGEVVFNTSMVGYQEIITDPACSEQILVMSYPLIGNYGINLEDTEWRNLLFDPLRPHARALIVRERCDSPNNWRCEMELTDFMKTNKIVGLSGIDTRALTKALRNNGAMRGIITRRNISEIERNEMFENYNTKNAVLECSTKEKFVIDGDDVHLAVIDLGTRRSLLELFRDEGCKLTVFPANATYAEISEVEPDAVLVTDGPGGPFDIDYVCDTIKQFIGKKPILSIGLGYLCVGMALGMGVKRLKFGEHGANYPVKCLETGKIHITYQNHIYSLKDVNDEVDVLFMNVKADGNDENYPGIQGITHKTLPIIGVGFYPDKYVMDKFMQIAKRG